jgi:diguanylate cyclase
LKLERGFGRSRVARRIVALFVLCALVPIVATALLSYDHVRKLLLDQSHLHLAQLGESYSSALYERLAAVRRILQEIEPGAEAGAAWTAERRDQLRTQLDALAVIGSDGAVNALLGSARPFAPLSESEAGHLAKGKAVLRTRTNPDASATVFIAQAIEPATLAAGIVVGEINVTYLWGESDALPAVTNFAVIGSNGEPLFSSQGRSNALLAAFAQRVPRVPNGRLVYAEADGAEVASYRELFLESHYFPGGWTIVATRPEVEVLAPIAAYKQSFVLATALALLVIALFSAAQIRRTLVPLERLIEGTRRAANKDFGVRVDVANNDEFGELARSFNTMAARLGRQFTALSTLADIDRAILSRPDVERVIEAVLWRISAIVPVQHAGIVIADRHTVGTTLVYTRRGGDDGTIDLQRITSAVDGARGLDGLMHEGEWVPATADAPPWAATFLKLGTAAIFAAPIIWQGEVIGAIGVGAARIRLLTDDEEARIRDLADRIGVAFAAAAKDEQLYYQAHYDALSKLPNRLFFKDQLERAIARAQRHREGLAVLFVDLDHFKRVNDSNGHDAGDAVLVEAAERIRRCVRTSDIVGRLGGDEFAVLVAEVTNGHDARVVADNIIAALSQPFVDARQEHFLSASVGIAVFPVDGAGADELLRNADTAMYRAKEGGRGQSVFFETQMNLAALARVHSERDLRHALAQREFFLVYQPMLDLRSGCISGAEALLRWNHPEHGALAPTTFIQLAEESGLIDVLGEWVLREACAQFRAVRDLGVPLASISVNVSARQFKQANFTEIVHNVLRETGVPGTCLELEITESLLLDATPAVEGALATLNASGIRIALDDFGTGYSSLAYLRRFPVDIVKIDRSFVKDLPADKSSAAITGAIISMAHALQKQVVAEGVAFAEQQEFLRDLGCDHIQGYHLAEPLPSAELVAFLRRIAGRADTGDTPVGSASRAQPAFKAANRK